MGIKKALTLARTISTNRIYVALEFLILGGVHKPHILSGIGKFGSTLKDVSALTTLPMFGDTHAMGIVLDEEDKEKLKILSEVFMGSRTSGKGTYVAWIRYFEIGNGKNNSYKVESIVSYYLSWFVLTSSLEDEPNSFVFPLAFLLAKGKRLALSPLYLGSLFDRVDERVSNIVDLSVVMTW